LIFTPRSGEALHEKTTPLEVLGVPSLTALVSLTLVGAIPISIMHDPCAGNVVSYGGRRERHGKSRWTYWAQGNRGCSGPRNGITTGEAKVFFMEAVLCPKLEHVERELLNGPRVSG
jgi:hypothetical protein